jgi:hypothetical protein
MAEEENGFLGKIKSLIVKKPVRQDIFVENVPGNATVEY